MTGLGVPGRTKYSESGGRGIHKLGGMGWVVCMGMFDGDLGDGAAAGHEEVWGATMGGCEWRNLPAEDNSLSPAKGRRPYCCSFDQADVFGRMLTSLITPAE